MSMPVSGGFPQKNLASTLPSENLARIAEKRKLILEILLSDGLTEDEINEENIHDYKDALKAEVDGFPTVDATAAFTFLKMIKNGSKYMEGVAGVVGTRIGLAQVARSMDLPDHAIFSLQKAYGDITMALDFILSLFKWEDSSQGLTIPAELHDAINSLRFLKDKVMIEIKLTLGGLGISVSLEEIEALMSSDADFDENMPDAKKELLQKFYNGMDSEKRKELIERAGSTILGGLPQLIDGAAKTLFELTDDESITTGPALMGVNSALTKLEGAMAVIRILSNGKNSLLSSYGNEANKLQGQVFKLQTLANQIFRGIANRTAQKIRLPIDENMEKMKQAMGKENPKEIKKNAEPSLKKEPSLGHLDVLKNSVLNLGKMAKSISSSGGYSSKTNKK